jgi:hypothetical protein
MLATILHAIFTGASLVIGLLSIALAGAAYLIDLITGRTKL